MTKRIHGGNAPGKTPGPPRHSARRIASMFLHPRMVPIVQPEDEGESAPDQPFAEGAYDGIDPDLRHRLISDAAFQHYVQRGYADGGDVDDWLQAEAEVDHLVVNR